MEKSQIVLTTTQGFETHKIQDYLGIVNGVAVLGFTKAMEIALEDLRQKAAAAGADAVVAIHFDYDSISSKGKDFTMVVATGTAVRFASTP